ncbi:MAG TPA: L-threonylcarbamoyladenylate synthase [Gaiellaceae bacterium]|nr:L-threonylcarbamoyladenylate synthase [Gaiellaceae bacterium]
MGYDARDRMIVAIRAGRPVLLPTDTVYGLATSADREDYATGLYRLKNRPETQPSALLAADLDALFESLPELRGRSEAIVRALLPGPYTLVLPNPARRYRWLTGTRADAIGVRVPKLPAAAHSVVAAVGCVIATSANEPGGPSPASLEEVPARIRAAVAAELDVGTLPGTPSTVIDFTRAEPSVIREGAASAVEAIERVRAALPG